MSFEFKPYPFSARQYNARLPQLEHGIEVKPHPVVIVGGGPVGLCAALGLANHGIASVLVEADDSVCSGSRAICISRRSLEIIERLGAVLPECPLTIVEGGASKDGHLTDLIGPHFTAFYFSEKEGVPASLAELEAAVQGKNIPFRLLPLTMDLRPDMADCHGWDHTGRLFAMYGARPGTLYLVRPDGHVLGRWHAATVAEVASAIERALHP